MIHCHRRRLTIVKHLSTSIGSDDDVDEGHGCFRFLISQLAQRVERVGQSTDSSAFLPSYIRVLFVSYSMGLLTSRIELCTDVFVECGSSSSVAVCDVSDGQISCVYMCEHSKKWLRDEWRSRLPPMNTNAHKDASMT